MTYKTPFGDGRQLVDVKDDFYYRIYGSFHVCACACVKK